jgi:SNF2-related domain
MVKTPPCCFFIPLTGSFRFTYLSKKDRERVLEVISNIRSFFRWCLSGTPKHANFNDINSLSALLGVHLGVDEVLPGVKLNKKYMTENENTGLESLSHYLESRSLQWHFRRHNLAQQFLNRFVRQNVAEIDEIPYEEHICAVNLPPVERAIYMELETHLKSLEMNSNTAQKSKRKSTGDRESRMQRILQDSESGEEALLKCCSHFNMSASFTALETIDDIIKLRETEKNNLEDEMIRSLAAAFRQEKKILRFQPDWSSVSITGKGEVQDALRVFLVEVQAKKSVPHGADNEINDHVSCLVGKGQKHFETYPNECDLFFTSSVDSDDEELHQSKTKKLKRPLREIDETALFEMKHALRNHMHFIRSLAKELCGRVRSLRYIQHIRRLQLNEKENETDFVCRMCEKDVQGLKCTIAVLSCCGHAGCIDCLRKRAYDGLCIVPDCCARVSSAHIASADRLGLENEDSCSGRFGRKLTAVVAKVKEILRSEEDDRMIVFCQFDDLKSKIAEALSTSNIKSLEVKGTVGQQINTLSIFQKDRPDISDPRVLLLKMDDEQSAGLNLTVSLV